jgi:hypothetical protein
VITHSSIAILLIWLMKPNVFELHAPISNVAMLGRYHDVGWDFFVTFLAL